MHYIFSNVTNIQILFMFNRIAEDCGTIQENLQDPRTKVPWVAGIFARSNSKLPFRFLITGTVLSPHVVLTIFAGAYGESTKKGGKYVISPSSNHIVAV